VVTRSLILIKAYENYAKNSTRNCWRYCPLVNYCSVPQKGLCSCQRDYDTHKPKAEVFEYIKFLKNQDEYSVWAEMDPNMKKEYRGTDGTVGFVSAWESKDDNVGKGEQEIKKIKDGERMDMELRFIKPFEATDNAYMATESMSESDTKVVWGFNGRMDIP
jgi:hypothetical protein